jgi:hypothetical protein
MLGIGSANIQQGEYGASPGSKSESHCDLAGWRPGCEIRRPAGCPVVASTLAFSSPVQPCPPGSASGRLSRLGSPVGLSTRSSSTHWLPARFHINRFHVRYIYSELYDRKWDRISYPSLVSAILVPAQRTDTASRPARTLAGGIQASLTFGSGASGTSSGGSGRGHSDGPSRAVADRAWQRPAPDIGRPLLPHH